MSAAWAQVIVESAGVLVGAGLLTWLWRGPRRYREWRKRKRRDEILGYVITASVITLAAALLLGKGGNGAA